MLATPPGVACDWLPLVVTRGSRSGAAHVHMRLTVTCGSSGGAHGVGHGSQSHAVGCGSTSHAARVMRGSRSGVFHSRASFTVGGGSRSGRRSSPSPTAPIDGLGPHRRPRLTDPRGSQTPDSQPAAFPTSTAHSRIPPSCVRLSDHDLGLIDVDAANRILADSVGGAGLSSCDSLGTVESLRMSRQTRV